MDFYLGPFVELLDRSVRYWKSAMEKFLRPQNLPLVQNKLWRFGSEVAAFDKAVEFR